MPCFRPWKLPRYHASGKRYTDLQAITVPCRQCQGCRVDHARGWGLRCLHESTLHEASSFLTLTYSDEHYPDAGSVEVRPLQLFQKRVRNEHGKVRFFSCGEYSPGKFRAHYHVLLFGYDFPDRKLWSSSKSGHRVYISEELQSLWPHGHSYIGDVTFQSCAYVARYATKKINGKKAGLHYYRAHPITGEMVQLRPEFITMSRRPGIGAGWFEKYGRDAFPSDYLIHEGSKVAVPPFYLRRLKQAEDQERLLVPSLSILDARKQRARLHADNNTPERLAVREEVAERKFALLHRAFEATM